MSEELLSQVLSRLTDMLADEFCRLISAVKTFTSAGAVTVSLTTAFYTVKSSTCHAFVINYLRNFKLLIIHDHGMLKFDIAFYAV